MAAGEDRGAGSVGEEDLVGDDDAELVGAAVEQAGSVAGYSVGGDLGEVDYST